jgi:hypothetical protein
MVPRASSARRGVRRLCGMYIFTTNPFCGWDVNKTPRSRVERLPPSSHVKEPSVTAHYEHYAHDECSIRDLLHWQNYPSLPISFPYFESRGVYIFKCSRPEYSWKIARWTLNTNQSINQSINLTSHIVGVYANTVKPAMQSHVLKGHLFLACHRIFHMNKTSFKRSPVL